MYNKLPCKECPHGVNGICKIENCRLWFDYIKRDKEERESLKKYIERRVTNEILQK